MTTPNLDVTQHHWEESLAGFAFSIEYQKGWNNMAANSLSWVKLSLDVETMKSILDGITVGLTGRADGHNQMLMCMKGKLSKEWKVDWPKHLPELVYAYNSTRLAISRYSSHYLMFGHWPCLPINFYFPMIKGTEKHHCVDYYVAKLCEWQWQAFKEAQVQFMLETARQKWDYDRKANAISLEPGDLVLAKSNAYMGKGKVKNQWEEEL